MAAAQNLLERAKQGEPEAIASLMNQTLNAKDAHVQIKRRGCDYRLLVESAQPPDKASTVRWIASGLKKLSIPRMDTVVIYGKAKASDRPAWTHSFHFSALSKGDLADPFAEDAAQVQQSSAEPPLDLTGYCFTRNKSLLSGNLTLPSKAVIEGVLLFESLPNDQKLALLPHVDKLLRKPATISDDALNAKGESWIAKVVELEGNDLRKLSIWLSRYCVNPIETVEQLTPKPVAEDPAPPVDSTEDVSSEKRGLSDSPVRSARPTIARSASAAVSNLAPSADSEKVMFARGSNTPVWAFPAACSLFLVIAIALGISSVDEITYAYPTCDSASDLESCVLSMQLADDEQDLEKALLYSYAAPAISSEMIEAVEKDCNEAVSFYYTRTGELEISSEDVATLIQTKSEASKYQLSFVDYQFRNGVQVSTQELIDFDYTQSLTSSHSQSPLPGLLLTDVVHRSNNGNNTIRAACLHYAHSYSAWEVAEYDVSPTEMNILGISEIPINWPEDPFVELSEEERTAARSLGIYDVFISLGANTLFTAVGIFVAVMFSACYRCYTYAGVYQMASVLGVIETIMYSIPGFGWLASLATDVVAMGLASRFVKDFHIDWTGGYGPLARGVLMISAVRMLLSLMLYWAIAQLV